jgi:hypothetical protein
MTKLFSIALSLALISVAACSKDDKDSKSSSKAATGSTSKDSKKSSKKGSGPAALTIEKLGLKAQAPSGTKVSDGVLGDGAMLQGPDLVVQIELATDMTPETVDAAKEEADMYSPKNLETETLADGWALTFDNVGSMGTNYFVQVRRDLGGKAYWCTTTASSEAQKANALAACKSLAL